MRISSKCIENRYNYKSSKQNDVPQIVAANSELSFDSMCFNQNTYPALKMTNTHTLPIKVINVMCERSHLSMTTPQYIILVAV